ncbi:hypothetical protein NEOLEDRAFT_489034 [Neolentinus lepideus HHB14362 ss-1]|uniref:ARID domain-containing protein n=1 Tax=Neolentinus lepideus HHB14362 ss-1 TaxID=1314782 RepID=A0A165VNS9_9AGAM|nr:hypothetical protein NEOLEDRAFT_489034 [Neolentinus lepideus HHB14362 ss-1]
MDGAQLPPVQNAQPLSSATLQLLQSMPPDLLSFMRRPISPLDAQRFRETYTNFQKKRGATLDERGLMINGRSIDLHTLHAEVVQVGGGKIINAKNMWAAIGARMGFVQFPEAPGEANAGLAQQLSHVYALYLKDYDDLYAQTIIRSRFAQVREMTHTARQTAQVPGMSPDPVLGRDYLAHPANDAPPLSSSVSSAVTPSRYVSRRPTQEQLRESIAHVESIRKRCQACKYETINFVPLTEEQKAKYTVVLEKLCLICDAMEPNLPLFYAVCPQEDIVPKILALIHLKDLQRIHLSSSNPKSLVPLEMLQQIALLVHAAAERFAEILAALNNQENVHQGPDPRIPAPTASANPLASPVSETSVAPDSSGSATEEDIDEAIRRLRIK